MRYCKRCLYPENHPLGITFDDEGVCSGCRVHEEKDEIDWREKEAELDNLLSPYRGRPGTSYDCIIPVNGNGDSFFVVDTIKNKYGLNPLLVTYNTHFNTKVGVRNLARLITRLDCDHLMCTVGPDTAKKLTRSALRKFGDMYWHVLAGTQTFPVRVATKMKVPLIVWGVNGWLDQVGMYSHYDAVEMTKKVRKEHSLRQMDADSFIGPEEGISGKDLQAFTYPSDVELEQVRMRGIYLGNYVRWDAQRQTEDMIRKYGYETREQERTFNRYETICDRNNAGVHDYVKFLKYGFGKATDHACRDIRLGRMTREQGIELVRRYDAVKPRSLELFLDWVNMTEEEFMVCVDRFRDHRAWEQSLDGTWTQKDSIIQHIHDEGVDMVRLTVDDPREYVQTPLLEPEDDSYGYIMLGRTYLDEENYKAVEG